MIDMSPGCEHKDEGEYTEAVKVGRYYIQSMRCKVCNSYQAYDLDTGKLWDCEQLDGDLKVIARQKDGVYEKVK